jgi:hypothetical protein
MMPPNGCVYAGGDFSPADFSGTDFDLGSMVCGPYFMQAQEEFEQVQAQQIYQQAPAVQICSNVQAQQVDSA